MVVLIIYFLLVFLLVFPVGHAMGKLLIKDSLNTIDALFLGLLGVTLISSIWIFFAPLGILWSGSLIIFSVACGVINRLTIIKQFKKRQKLWLLCSKSKKIFFFLILTSIAFCSSLPASLLDNETYYLQTIKWLDEYGLVKGLSNLHIYLSQQSGFHVLEAALNFNALYDRWNDVGSFYFLLGCLWSLQSVVNEGYLLKYYRRGFMILSIILYSFISAPSPDISVYVLSYIVIYKFISLWGKYDQKQLLLLALFSMQLLYFKVSTALIFLLFIALLVKYRNIKKSNVWMYFGLLFTGLFISKNLIVNGLPFYPLTFWSPWGLAWSLPSTIAVVVPNQAYLMTVNEVQEQTFESLFNRWFFLPGIDGFLNKVVVVCYIIATFFLVITKKRIALKLLIVLLLLQGLILAFTSPQFRFFLNLIVPVMVLIFLSIFKPNKLFLKYAMVTCLVLGLGIAISNIKNPQTDQNNVASSSLSSSIIFEPSPKSVYSTSHKRIIMEQFYYNNREADGFFFGIYDIPLPATSKKYVDYIKEKYGLQPEMMGNSIKDGFKYVKSKD